MRGSESHAITAGALLLIGIATGLAGKRPRCEPRSARRRL